MTSAVILSMNCPAMCIMSDLLELYFGNWCEKLGCCFLFVCCVFFPDLEFSSLSLSLSLSPSFPPPSFLTKFSASDMVVVPFHHLDRLVGGGTKTRLSGRDPVLTWWKVTASKMLLVAIQEAGSQK